VIRLDNKIGKIYVGGNRIGKVFVGDNKVYPANTGPVDPTPPSSGSAIVFYSLAPFFAGSSSKTWDGTVQYSTNGSSWTVWNGTEIYSILSSGLYKLYFRGTGNTRITGNSGVSWYIDTDYSSENFVRAEPIYCTGNLKNLLDYSTTPVMAEYALAHMFAQVPELVSAPSMSMTALSPYCYYCMFAGCWNLRSAPTSLPATTLAESCYKSMFYDCRELKIPPALPAKTMAKSCYYEMFFGSGLTTLPYLPATTLAPYCYTYMFADCHLGDPSHGNAPFNEFKEGKYMYEWRVPKSGTISNVSGMTDWDNMFEGYTFPERNTTYYVINQPVG